MRKEEDKRGTTKTISYGFEGNEKREKKIVEVVSTGIDSKPKRSSFMIVQLLT